VIHTNPHSSEYLFINFFRAFAAFWVVAAHAVMWNKIEPMTMHTSWYKFWLRRLFRIAPAYYLSLFTAILLSNYFLEGYHLLQIMNPNKWAHSIVYNPMRIDYDIMNILLHISFLFGLHPQYSFSTFLPDWSLSLEMQFYFIFPFIFIAMIKYGVKKSILIIGLNSIFIGFTVNRFVHFYEPSFLAFKLQYFISGVLLFYILHQKKSTLEFVLLCILALFFVSVEFVLNYGTERVIPAILFSLMFLLGWLETSQRLPSLIHTLFHSHVIGLMSDSSYSVYLFHGFFISLSGLLITFIPFLKESSLLIHTAFMFVFVISFTYPLAYFIFLRVEKPGMRYGKFLIDLWLPKKGIKDE